MGTRFLKKTFMVSLVVPTLALGGCAQLQNYGGNFWHGTQSVTQSVGSVLTSLLRPAPVQNEKFLADGELPAQVEGINFVEILTYSVEEETPPVQFASLRGVSNMDIHDESKVIAMPVIPVLMAELSAPILPFSILPVVITIPNMNSEDMLAGAPTTPRKVSLIKTTGQTNTRDLSTCAETAGKILVENFTGYEINPDFLICMQGMGYSRQ